MSFLSSRRSRLAAAAAALAVGTLTLAGCGGSSGSTGGATDGGATGAAGSTDLTLQLSWIKNEEFCGEFFADSKGYWTDAGLSSVELVPGPSTGAAELISGSADVALSDAVSIGSVVASEGAPLKIIGTTFQKNPFTVLSLADGGNITTPQDLIGKKIGVQDSNTALFNALLLANDIDPSQVTVVPVQYDPAPLTNGEVDGFIAYLTNEAITVAAAGNEVANLPFADNGLPFVAETVTTTDDMIANNRDALKSFLVGEIKGWSDAVNDPQGCADLAVTDYGKDLDLDAANSLAGAKAELSDLVVSDETEANGLFTISDDLQASTIASLNDAGIQLAAGDLFDMSILDEVYSENPDLVAYAK